MTLFIDVQGVPNAILDLVKARILANRKRSKERGLAAAAKPEQQQPARRRYYSPLAPDRRPEPAGIPLRGVNGVALAWVYGMGSDDGIDADIAVECASRESRQTFKISTSSATITSINWNDVMLPCGGDNAIVVFTTANVLPPGDTRTYTPAWEAVVVSRTASRRITVPSAFRSAYTSSPYTQQFTPSGYPTSGEYGFGRLSVVQYGFNFNELSGLPDGFFDVEYISGPSQTQTPGWYGLLSASDIGIPPFSEDDVASPAWAKRYFLTTAPTPEFELSFCVREGTCPRDRFDIDKFPYSPLSNTTRERSLYVRSNIKSITFDSSAPGPGGLLEEANRVPIISWDWGQPTYCRQQLLALGFTEADLTP